MLFPLRITDRDRAKNKHTSRRKRRKCLPHGKDINRCLACKTLRAIRANRWSDK